MNLELQMQALAQRMTSLNGVVIKKIEKNKMQFYCDNNKVLVLLAHRCMSPNPLDPKLHAAIKVLPETHLFEMIMMPKDLGIPKSHSSKKDMLKQAECALLLESDIEAAACDVPELYR